MPSDAFESESGISTKATTTIGIQESRLTGQEEHIAFSRNLERCEVRSANKLGFMPRELSTPCPE